MLNSAMQGPVGAGAGAGFTTARLTSSLTGVTGARCTPGFTLVAAGSAKTGVMIDETAIAATSNFDRVFILRSLKFTNIVVRG